MESTRLKKVSRLLQKELAEIFRIKSHILPGKMISVTVVRVSPDLGLAKVYLSIFPNNEGEEVLPDIEKHKYEVKKDLAVKIKNQIRKIPELAFFIDDSLDYVDNIERLLNN